MQVLHTLHSFANLHQHNHLLDIIVFKEMGTEVMRKKYS